MHNSLSILGSLLLTAAAVAETKVNWLYPAGASRGQTMTVTAGGSFDRWPLQVWLDDPRGVTIEPHKDKGKFTVTVNADAPPGVRWLRVYDEKAASNLRPFVIGHLSDVAEKETNDLEPQVVELPAVVNGKLAKRNDIDIYRVTLKQGETLVAAMDANAAFGSPMDGLLQLCSADGFVIEQDDDTVGLDPRIVFTAPVDGDYLLRAFAFPATPTSSISFAGGDDYIYRLTLTTGGFIDHTLPLAVQRGTTTEVRVEGWNVPAEARTITLPSDPPPLREGLGEGDQPRGDTVGSKPDADANRESPPPNLPLKGEGSEIKHQSNPHTRSITLFSPHLAKTFELALTDAPSFVADASSSRTQPQGVALPVVITGRIDNAKDEHFFRFTGKKDKAVRIAVASRSLGYPLDAVIRVLDADGKELADKDDADRSTRDPALDFTPKQDGEYLVAIADLHRRGGMRFVYRLTIKPIEPDFALSLEKDVFVAAPGKAAEIAVKIDRRAGFDKTIAISIEGLPADAKVSGGESQPKGGSAKEVKLKVTPGKTAFSGPVRVVGRAGEASRVATFKDGAIGEEHDASWIVLPAGK